MRIPDDHQLTLTGCEWREADGLDVRASVITDTHDGSHFDHRAAGGSGAQLDRDGLVGWNRHRALIATREAKW